MANIPALPSADVLIAKGVTRAEYGPHLFYEVLSDGSASLFDGGKGVLVRAGINAPTIYLSGLSPETVPYVNKFIAHTGLKVEKYWRTGLYRVSGGPKRAPKGRAVTATATPYVAPVAAEPTQAEVTERVAVALEAVREELVAAPAPVITVAASDKHDDGEAIPGVEYPKPVKVKAESKGYVSVDGIVVKDAHLKSLQDALVLRRAGKVANVIITGPAGTAKTALARAFAASEGLPFLKVDGGSIRTADDWGGTYRQDPNTKTWAHRWSPFARVLRKGEPTVVLIDEGNRTESPQALNALLGLCDWTGSLSVPDANATLKLPAGVLLIMTANIGPEFVGTLPLDGAVRQRFGFGVRMDYPPEAVEVKLLVERTGVSKDIAGKLVRMAASQRINREDPQLYPSGAVISTRVILDIAERIALANTDPRDAVATTLAGQFDPGDDDALSVVIDAQFPAPVAELTVEEVEAAKQPLVVVGKHWFTSPPSYMSSSECFHSSLDAQGNAKRCSKFVQDPVHFDND